MQMSFKTSYNTNIIINKIVEIKTLVSSQSMYMQSVKVWDPSVDFHNWVERQLKNSLESMINDLF